MKTYEPKQRAKFDMPGHRDDGKPVTVIREQSRGTTYAMYVVQDDSGETHVCGDWELAPLPALTKLF